MERGSFNVPINISSRLIDTIAMFFYRQLTTGNY